MARLVYGNLDLVGNLLQRFRVENLTADPTSGEGGLYYNSGTKELRYFDGAVWQTVATGATVDAALAALQAEIDQVETDLAAEVTARSSADSGLQSSIDNEAAARASADTGLQNTKADKAVTVTAGAGLQGGGTLAADFVLDIGISANSGLASDENGIWVNSGTAIESDSEGVSVKYGTGIALVADGDTLGVDTAWLATQIEAGSANNIEAGDGVDITLASGTDGADVISVQVSTDVDNAVTIGTDGGVHVADLSADITAVDTAYKLADTTLQTNIDAVAADLVTEAAAGTAADDALDARINGLSITGTGMATVTESELDSGIWTVDVPSLQLANTYTGTTGVDSGTINTDLTTQGATGQPGDLYINSGTGQAFINTGLAAPGDWVELSSAAVGLDSIASGDGSITVTDGAGPNADVAVSAALQTAISTSTTTNTAQDAAIGALETNDAAQDVTLGTLTTGLADEVAARESADVTLQGDIAAETAARTSADATKADKLIVVTAGQGLSGGGNLASNVTIDINAGVGLGVDDSGIWVNGGTAINAGGVDGVSVKYANGLDVVTDSLVVKQGSGIIVDSNGVSVDPGILSGGLTRFAAPLAASTAAQPFTHGLGTADVQVALYDGTGAEIWADVVVDATTVTVTTTPAVAGRVVVTA